MTSARPWRSFFYPDLIARKALADRLDLPFHAQMQDWEWEVADASRFEEFIQIYRVADLSDAERYMLMELLVQCVEDMELQPQFELAWASIESPLLARPKLHHSTIEYWACLDETDPLALFKVSRNMRKVWHALVR